MIVIVMGVSGSGKTTIGKALASKLKVPFLDADDFHPTPNIEKMKSGIPLTDKDRKPWLETLAEKIKDHQKSGLVLACSALKESYRQILISKSQEDVKWIYLKGDKEMLLKRMAKRNHFMPKELLDSQFETLEIPDYANGIDCSLSLEELVSEVLKSIYD